MELPAERPVLPNQFLAARAMLGWSLVEAAQRAGLSISAVFSCERRDRGRPKDACVHALTAAYRGAGVRFLSGAADGVELLASHAAEARAD